MADRAHQLIKRQILLLELEPGARIDDNAMSAHLRLSRTPVREALFRLASEGLVTVGQQGGFTVRSMDLLDVSQLFEAHAVLARAIARLCAARCDDAAVAGMREISERVDAAVAVGDPAAIVAHNADLHRLEADVAHNEHLRRAAYSIHDQGHRLAFLCFGGRQPSRATGLDDHYARTCADHAALLEAYAERDPDSAERIAARHVHLFRERVVHFLTVDGAGDVDLVDELPAPLP